MKPKPAALPKAPEAVPPAGGAWVPDWRWHAKALGGIALFLLVAYAALTVFLSRLPPPYGLRRIPPEMTPWLKK